MLLKDLAENVGQNCLFSTIKRESLTGIFHFSLPCIENLFYESCTLTLEFHPDHPLAFLF